MNEVTSEFQRYDLGEINLECLKHASDGEKENILPKTVGGSKDKHVFSFHQSSREARPHKL